jgi:hypothetical protein
MTSSITDSIYRNLEILFETNQMLHDYWASELWEEDGEVIYSMWNEDTLKELQNDVVSQQQLLV